MHIALINTNRMQPPIAPIGLDYIAEALHAAGHSVALLDLCWEEDPQSAAAQFLQKRDFGLVGVTLRNTDDCAFTNCQSFLPGFLELLKTVRENTDAFIVLGGVGFSVMPERILSETKADFGVWGEGEFTVSELANHLERKRDWHDLPGLVWPDGGVWRRNPPSWRSLRDLPRMSRTWVDNRRYFREGGQAGFETKRGCSGNCIYCADPPAKGNCVRVRPAAAVAEELESLIAQSITALHTCDGEFNIQEKHAFEICSEITRRGLGSKMRWYAYCTPVPFSRELARSMRLAGCVGIDFGADNGNKAMLKSLGRDFGPADSVNATRWAKEEGMAVMLDLLLGAPGESRESIGQTVEMVRKAGPDLAGVSLGVRLFPGTELHARLGNGDPIEPTFFLEPRIAPYVFDWIHDLIGEDRRFLFFDPSRPQQNYNYNSNQRILEAIRQGYRGAFWDILRITNCE